MTRILSKRQRQAALICTPTDFFVDAKGQTKINKVIPEGRKTKRALKTQQSLARLDNS
jgi:hypothetical protein